MGRAIILSLLTLLSTQMFAQDNIVDRIVYVRHLVSDSVDYNPREALSQLQLLEKDCQTSDNDTLEAVYLELKGQALFLWKDTKSASTRVRKQFDCLSGVTFGNMNI